MSSDDVYIYKELKIPNQCKFLKLIRAKYLKVLNRFRRIN